MRKIEFKAKSRLDNKWIYGFFMRNYFSNRFGLVSAIFYNNYDTNKTLRIPIYEETVSQYIGLEDKFGNKIYENDIVYIVSEDEKGVIEYDNNMAMFIVVTEGNVSYDFDYLFGKDLEVIGNKYD